MTFYNKLESNSDVNLTLITFFVMKFSYPIKRRPTTQIFPEDLMSMRPKMSIHKRKYKGIYPRVSHK